MSGAIGSDTGLWSAFTAKAELVGAAVLRATTESAARGLLAEAGDGLVRTARVERRFPTVAAQLPVTSSEAEPAREVVSAAEFAVAETGSVALNEPAPDRRACFLADRLWLLVPADQVVASLDQALDRIAELLGAGAHHPVLMTGPSRTADIERTLTVGVHGPRSVVIIIVGA